jgi:hypothetical protein
MKNETIASMHTSLIQEAFAAAPSQRRNNAAWCDFAYLVIVAVRHNDIPNRVNSDAIRAIELGFWE